MLFYASAGKKISLGYEPMQNVGSQKMPTARWRCDRWGHKKVVTKNNDSARRQKAKMTNDSVFRIIVSYSYFGGTPIRPITLMEGT
jgi:hypothetical protein